MNKKHFTVLFFMALFIIACKKGSPIINEIEKFVGFKKPTNFPEPEYNFANNQITEDGFILGRTLFYDGRLSRDNTISCGSCHIQSSAFTQHGHDVSHGIDDRLGIRNSPPIMNLAWNKAFMWGGGIYDLDLQPIAPITAHEEMDETVENVMV
ncbi:MAG: cytochrome-c peroxidase, partial [Pedobacter sp.]